MLDSLTENETRLILRNWTTMSRALDIMHDPRFKLREGDHIVFLIENFSEHYCFLWYSSPIEAIIAHKFAKKHKTFGTSALIEDREYCDKFIVMLPIKVANQHFYAHV